MLRVPLLSVDETARVLAACDSEFDAVESVDGVAGWTALALHFATPVVGEALRIASPVLADALGRVVRGDEAPSVRMRRSLVRYLLRMGWRSTPFGLFAQVAPAAAGPNTEVRIANSVNVRRQTRLDMEVVLRIVSGLEARDDVRASVRYNANPTWYVVGDEVRFIRTQRTQVGLAHELASAAGGEALQELLAFAAVPRGWATLVGHVVAMGYASDEAEEFTLDVLKADLLRSELRPTLTDPSPFDALHATLRERAAPEGVLEAIERTAAALRALDENLVPLPQAYENAQTAVVALLANESLPAHWLQVDSVRPVEKADVDDSVPSDILAAMAAVEVFFADTPREQPWSEFARRFEERFATNVVPFMEALDPELGLTFAPEAPPDAHAAVLLSDFKGGAVSPPGLPLGPAHQRLLMALVAARDSGCATIDVRTELLRGREVPAEPQLAPDTFSVLASLGRSEAARDAGQVDAIVIQAYHHPGAGVMGRFCHLDESLQSATAAYVRAEESLLPGVLPVELICQPQGRVGNVLLRPPFRRCELPLLGRARTEPENTVLPSDLALSLRDGRPRLHSLSRQCEILPRLTNAHNHRGDNNIGHYRLLAALQMGGARLPFWDWGPLGVLPTLPRVTCGRVVVARAQWRLLPSELTDLESAAKRGECDSWVQAWRAKRALPRFVNVGWGDQVLMIDLDSPTARDVLTDLLLTEERVGIHETLPAPDAVLVESQEGRFASEIALPFMNRRPSERQAPAWNAAITQPNARARSLGDEWVYAKFYCDPIVADTELLPDLERRLTATAESGSNEWYFVRFHDPASHLRVRVRVRSAAHTDAVIGTLRALGATLTATRRVHRWVLDTYAPEIERYGGADGMGIAEHLFCVDSEFALALLRTLTDAKTPVEDGLRPLVTAASADAFCASLGLDLSARAELFARVRERFVREHRLGRTQERRLSTMYRQWRPKLDALLARDLPISGPEQECIQLLDRRRDRIIPITETLRTAIREGRVHHSLSVLAESYVHMHFNRMLRTRHRLQETVFYDFLSRSLRSRIARAAMPSSS